MNQTIISVLGPSGGIGKSTLAKELAIAFAATKLNNQPLSVCVMDLNLCFGSQKSLFGLIPKHTIEDWLIELRSMSNHSDAEILESMKWKKIEKYLSYSKRYNLFVVPSPSNGHYIEISTRELNLFVAALKQFFDVIVMDTGNNLETVTVASMIVSDINVLIATDEIRTASSIKKLRKRARDEKIPMEKFVAVVNKYPDVRDGRLFSREDLEKILYMDIPVVIPCDKRTWAYNNTCASIVLDQERSKIKKAILDLARILVPETNPDSSL